MFPRLALRSFQGMAFVALRFALRSFQGCVPFVPAAAVAVRRSKIFMGLQDIVCVRCPRGSGVHRERQAAAGYRFSMLLADSTSIVAPFYLDALALVCLLPLT